MHSKMQYIGYSLMIVAYSLFIFEKKGFAITALIIATILIATNIFIKKQSRHNIDKQSIGDKAKGKNISFENINQQSTSQIDTDVEQSVGNSAKAKEHLTFKNVKQNKDCSGGIE